MTAYYYYCLPTYYLLFNIPSHPSTHPAYLDRQGLPHFPRSMNNQPTSCD